MDFLNSSAILNAAQLLQDKPSQNSQYDARL